MAGFVCHVISTSPAYGVTTWAVKDLSSTPHSSCFREVTNLGLSHLRRILRLLGKIVSCIEGSFISYK